MPSVSLMGYSCVSVSYGDLCNILHNYTDVNCSNLNI